MIVIIQGGDESEAEISKMTSQAFQKALDDLALDYKVLDYSQDLGAKLLEVGASRCLLALHGRFGEDGVVQGLLEHLEIPYSGSGVLASSLCFDKVFCLKWTQALGLPVLPHYSLKKGQSVEAQDQKTIQAWSDGFVVKPSRSGSSRGVSLCDQIEDLAPALDEAFKWSKEVLVEKRVKGREITVSLFDGEVFEPIEIRPKTGFYDMKNKYTKGATDYLIPAPVGTSLKEACQKTALKIFRDFNLKVYARVDFIITPDESDFYLLEVNTLPGCTPTSLLPKALAQRGIEFKSLVKKLVESASLES